MLVVQPESRNVTHVVNVRRSSLSSSTLDASQRSHVTMFLKIPRRGSKDVNDAFNGGVGLPTYNDDGLHIPVTSSSFILFWPLQEPIRHFNQ